MRTINLVFLSAFLGSTVLIRGNGSGLNTIVIANQASPNSCELANYYCERRSIPPQNLLRIRWPGGNVSWSRTEFEAHLLRPLEAMLEERSLVKQASYLVLSMDIPFRVEDGSVINSTTSALFYGLRGLANDPKDAYSTYAASEADFRSTPPQSNLKHAFLCTMITSDSLSNAKRLVDQGVDSDGRFPEGSVMLIKSSDPNRNIRWPAFDSAIFDTRLRGNYSIIRTNVVSTFGHSGLLGMQTGVANFRVSPGTFFPGAMADNMTSFGGILFGPNGQTSLLEFINAGAAGSYGTVAEPSAHAARFPSPHVYFYQARGFSIADCYYQSLRDPHLGLIVAEPLAAPFARPGSGRWPGLQPGAEISGTTNLALQFTAADSTRPIQQVDLFVDGYFFATVTNLVPSPGTVHNLTVNGVPLAYTVPNNATLDSIAEGVASGINQTADSSKVRATAHGDRVDVRITSGERRLRPAAPQSLRSASGSADPSDAASPARSGPFHAQTQAEGRATTQIRAERSASLPSSAHGFRSYMVGGTVRPGTWITAAITKTNGIPEILSVTNEQAIGTLMDLATRLESRINGSPNLADGGGLVIEDLRRLWPGSLTFTARARSPGLDASAVQVQLSCSSDLVVSPPGSGLLRDNFADLEPRTHFYVTAGWYDLAFTFEFDTTRLADGHHELTAVAYEGSHVRTQTHASIPVTVRNSGLNGLLDVSSAQEPRSVNSICSVRVQANVPDIRTITLQSTGGTIGVASNTPAATFDFPGTALGVGLHPFYALVETVSGGEYRTETRWLRLDP